MYFFSQSSNDAAKGQGLTVAKLQQAIAMMNEQNTPQRHDFATHAIKCGMKTLSACEMIANRDNN